MVPPGRPDSPRRGVALPTRCDLAPPAREHPQKEEPCQRRAGNLWTKLPPPPPWWNGGWCKRCLIGGPGRRCRAYRRWGDDAEALPSMGLTSEGGGEQRHSSLHGPMTTFAIPNGYPPSPPGDGGTIKEPPAKHGVEPPGPAPPQPRPNSPSLAHSVARAEAPSPMANYSEKRM